jgi:hypothetical protein
MKIEITKKSAGKINKDIESKKKLDVLKIGKSKAK